MNFARAIHFDESDRNVFEIPAASGEWCLSGGFEFSDWTEADLTGKARQAFANGWLGLESFGRVTFVAVTRIEADELAALTDQLAAHFVAHYGAPSLKEARPVAEDEIAYMRDICAAHAPNTLLTVSRELSEGGVVETFFTHSPREAGLDQFAIHISPED